MKKIIFVGAGRSGKDEACKYLAKITPLRNAGTTSLYLAKYVAERLGVTEAEAYARRHESDEMRTLWYNIGNEIREGDPLKLLKEALAFGELTGGLRDVAEVRAARESGVADLIVWISNRRVAPDPTMTFGSEECDIVVENHWSLEEYHKRLERLARMVALPKTVYAVLHADYGDQGVDYRGVFGSREAAERYILKQELYNRYFDRQDWLIEESDVQ